MILHHRTTSIRSLARLTTTFSRFPDTRSLSALVSEALKVAIVGSGPAGCYTAKYLQSARKGENIRIDVIEKLPTPFGLVRSGVAPDHPDVKNVQNDFSALFEDSNQISFFGNVSVGEDVSLKELREMYDVVVLAYGCQSDRKLGVPGEDSLTGVLCAREFVSWYNGHPDFGHVGDIISKALGTDPSLATVVVVGQGNVALDCARILAKGRKDLNDTDISSRALDVIGDGVKRTVVVGRRGHVQAAFTIKELRELVKLGNDGFEASFSVREEELNLGATEASLKELTGSGSRPKVRLDKVLREAAAAEPTNYDQSVEIRFLLNPVKFIAGEEDKLGAVLCERTRLEGDPGSQAAVGTGHHETIPANLALVSIGYKGLPLPGMLENGWFDERRGVVVNEMGRVAHAAGGLAGLYTSGWLKRGPSGIIGTNIPDAKFTVSTIMDDLENQNLKGTDAGLLELLSSRGVKAVNWDAYKRIEEAEEDPSRKRDPNQPREKIVGLQELLNVALN